MQARRARARRRATKPLQVIRDRASLREPTARLRAAGALHQAVLAEAVAALTASGFVPDYLSLVAPKTLQTWTGGPDRLLPAARLGDMRVLDNKPLG